MPRTLLALVAISSVIATPSAAQMMSNPTQWYVNNQIYSMRVFHSAIANSTLGRRNGTSGGRSPRGTPPARLEPTVYRESANSPLPARMAASGAGDRAEAERMFSGYIAEYKRVARVMKYAHNDLAFAYAYYVVNSYSVFHDLLDVPYDKDPRALRESDMFGRITAMGQKRQLQVTPERLHNVWEQFRAQLGADTDIRGMTDAQKQEATEMLATMTGVNHAVYMAGINAMNDRQAQQGRELARAGLEKMLGVPITHIGINTSGLDLSPP